MSEDLISVNDVAIQHGKRKQTVFKVLSRLGIGTTKRRSSSSKNQLVAYITQDDFQRVSVELQAIGSRNDPEPGAGDEADGFVSAEIGVFYLIQLEPEFDPGRFKVGFAAGLAERLRQLRCSAPFASVVGTWPCRRLWEKTAIESVASGCQRLHTEVFRTDMLDKISSRCEQFFAVMPAIEPGPSTGGRGLTGAAPDTAPSGAGRFSFRLGPLHHRFRPAPAAVPRGCWVGRLRAGRAFQRTLGEKLNRPAVGRGGCSRKRRRGAVRVSLGLGHSPAHLEFRN